MGGEWLTGGESGVIGLAGADLRGVYWRASGGDRDLRSMVVAAGERDEMMIGSSSMI